MTQNQIRIVGFLGVCALLAVVVLYIGWRDPSETNKRVELTVWGTEDASRVWEGIRMNYQTVYPNTQIDYVQFPEETYEESLINAFAAGSGPDIFMFHSSWLLEHYDKSAPAPSDLISLNDIQRLFPQVVEEDLVLTYDQEGGSFAEVYAMPLYVDTLALIYNKDILDARRIAVLPETWSDFKRTVLGLRTLSYGKITQAAAAIGGTEASVAYAPDILALIMRQFGAEMVDLNERQALFSSSEGKDALSFYLQFTDPTSAYYTWNDWFDNSIESFAKKQVGMIFGYSRTIDKIREQNAYLNIGVQYMPQANDGSEVVNTADYWGLGVWKDTKNYRDAWQFIIRTTTSADIMRSYAASTGKPPALRVLINDYLTHPTLGVFAEQALTARSWQKVNAGSIDTIFNTMISRTLDGSVTVDKAVEQADEAVTQLLQQW
jgi:multiple sugar transport system substrate-binding protein